jgi:hypothetical protein
MFYQPTWNNSYMGQNPYQQPMIPSQTVLPVNGITKVNGRDSAMQYQLPPNSMSPALFDNNGQVFYIVSTDGTGMKTVEAFDFSPHIEQPQQSVNAADFVSRAEFEGFVNRINGLLGDNNGIHGSIQTTAEASDSNGDVGFQA